MYFVSITRLRVRSYRFLPFFFLANERCVRAIETMEGFVGGQELMDKNLTFWTATIWRSDADMKSFRSCEPHKKAMRKLPNWCDEAAYAHWLQTEDAIPTWDILHERSLAGGRLSKVKYPSSIQQGVMAFPSPQRTKTGRKMSPRGEIVV
jgi:heme-degrading monooxygenase HmoA